MMRMLMRLIVYSGVLFKFEKIAFCLIISIMNQLRPHPSNVHFADDTVSLAAAGCSQPGSKISSTRCPSRKNQNQSN